MKRLFLIFYILSISFGIYAQKVLNEYDCIPGISFSAQDIADRGDDIGTKVVNGSNLKVSNISMSDIKNATGAPSYSLHELSRATNYLNEYSKFGIYTMVKGYANGEYFVDFNLPPNPPDNAPMGSFAGYDNDAPKAIIDPVSPTDISYGDVVTVSNCCNANWEWKLHYKINLGQLEYGLTDTNGKVVVRFRSTSDDYLYEESTAVEYGLFSIENDDNVVAFHPGTTFSSTTAQTIEVYAQICFLKSDGTLELKFQEFDSFKFSINFIDEPLTFGTIVLEGFAGGTYLSPVGLTKSIACDKDIDVTGIVLKDENENQIGATVDIYGYFGTDTPVLLAENYSISATASTDYSDTWPNDITCAEAFHLKFVKK